MTQRHDAQYSPEVVELLTELVNNPKATVDGCLFDPFAGTGQHLATIRDDFIGIDIEKKFAAASDRVRPGDALDPHDYPTKLGSIVTSPCYGNRMADQYLGRSCQTCLGTGKCFATQDGTMTVKERERGWAKCKDCEGSGHDPEDRKRRFGYAISLGQPTVEGSAASMHFYNGAKGSPYRMFHAKWLNLITQTLTPGPRRLILNMKDHYRTTTHNGIRAQRRQYVCAWWLHQAHQTGFRLTDAIPAMTRGIGYGANMQTGKADHEMVFVFDLPEGLTDQ